MEWGAEGGRNTTKTEGQILWTMSGMCIHLNMHKIHYTNGTRLERNHDFPVVQPAEKPMSRNVQPGSLFIGTFCNNATEMQMYHSLGLLLIHDNPAGPQHAVQHKKNAYYERSLFYQTNTFCFPVGSLIVVARSTHWHAHTRGGNDTIFLA